MSFLYWFKTIKGLEDEIKFALERAEYPCEFDNPITQLKTARDKINWAGCRGSVGYDIYLRHIRKCEKLERLYQCVYGR